MAREGGRILISFSVAGFLSAFKKIITMSSQFNKRLIALTRGKQNFTKIKKILRATYILQIFNNF